MKVNAYILTPSEGRLGKISLKGIKNQRVTKVALGKEDLL